MNENAPVGNTDTKTGGYGQFIEQNSNKSKYQITASHKVSGGRLWLYGGAVVLLGSTSKCVDGVLVDAYRISAPTNKPANRWANDKNGQ